MPTRPRREQPPERPSARTTGASGMGFGQGRASVSPVRWIVLALTLFICTVLVAPSLAALVRQRSEIGALEQQVSEQQGAIEGLQKQKDLWNDEAYVERQARDRLRFVRPGELSYQVLADGGRPAIQGVAQDSALGDRDLPWYGRLWGSVTAAAEGGPEGAVDQPAEKAPPGSPAHSTGDVTPSAPPTFIRDEGNPDVTKPDSEKTATP